MQRNTLFLAYFFICVNCFSQQYPFVHYTPKDGLVNSRIKKAYQDNKGRMYFLTFGGLSVYDGVRFRNYTMKNGLPTDVINDILEAGDDSLLIAANAGKLTALVKGQIVPIKTEGHSCPIINRFYQFKNDTYLACDDGLFILENKTIRQLDISLLSKQSSLAPYLDNIAGSGNYLVLTTHELRDRKGLYLYDIKTNRICDAIPDASVYMLGKDKKNNIWISMSNQLFVLDSSLLANGRLSLLAPYASYRQIQTYSTSSVVFDTDTMWLLYKNNYKNKDIRRIATTGSIIKIPLPRESAVSDIKSMFIDREKTIWLCTDGEGVFKMTSSPLLINENPFNKQISGYVNQAFYSNNIIWFGTSGNQLFRKSEKSLKEFHCNLNQAPVIIDEHENKLLARDIRNVYEANFSNNRTIHFRKIISLPDSDYFPNQVKVRNSFVFASLHSGFGIWKNDQQLVYFPVIKNDVVQDIIFSKNDWVWIATRHNGIKVFALHPENPSNYLQLVYYYPSQQITGSLRCITIDKNGLIWIGTRDHGVIGYRQKGNYLTKLYQFNVSNGLTDNFITSLACDSSNNIVVGTQTGLDRLICSQHHYRIENLSRSSNFFSLITQTWADAQQAYALSYSGALLKISSSMAAKTSASPQLLLEEIKVNAQAVPLKKNTFRHTENNLTFFVAAPSFIDEKQVAYSFLLKGSGNKKWSDTLPSNSVINLTNLSFGNYVLRVKAFFPSTSYAPVEQSYSFKINPPWWRTWWALTLFGSLIVAVLIIVIKLYYRRKLEKQTIILEKQQVIEKERTRIATDMHDDFGAGLSRIKFISQSVLNKKIEDLVIRSELEKITSYSDEMSEKMGEIVWALNEKNDTLADLIAYTRSYAVEYLQSHSIRCEADTPLNLPQTFLTGEVRRNIFLSVKECLHNIVKHSAATEVFFSVRLNNRMQIIIHDNGRGIDQGNQRMFSNGLDNIEKRMKDIKGKVNFISDHGTKVSMSIPVIV